MWLVQRLPQAGARIAWPKHLARWLPALPALLFLAVFFIVPVVEILQGGLYDGDGVLSVAQFARMTHSAVYVKVLASTFWIAFLTAALSVLLGYPVAYLLARLSARSRERWLLWIVLPFWTSYLVKTYAWMLLLSKTGLLTLVATHLGLLDGAGTLAPSLTGVLIGMVHAMLPLAVMTMLPIMRGINMQLVQAAQTLGADRATGFFTVFLPLSGPGAAAAGLLVFITSLGFFIVPALLGSPRESMVAQLVISSVLELFDLRFAGALSTVLLLCSIVVFFVYDRVVGLSSLAGEAPERRGGGQGGRLVPVLMTVGRLAGKLSFTRGGGGSAHGGFGLKAYTWVIVLALVLPIAFVVPLAFTKQSFVAFPPELFTMKWFVAFLESSVWQAALLRSLGVGFATAALALVLGFGASLALVRLPSRWRKPLFAVFIAPLIVPRIVVAVGLLYLFARWELAGTNAGLVIGHTVLAIPYVVVTLSASFKRFDWRLDDAAKMLGASAFTRVRTVLLPLLAASLGSAFLFAFIVSFDDLTIAIFVSGGINTTLPKQMWDDIQLAVTPTLAAVATSLVFLMAFVVWLSSIFKRKSY
ncbi:ABC transporter permease subunit [Pandoraea pulmonicola]|uniref:ABC transporter permease n=1 Tax=Pandoraea pulmonicola TaxID=93221 RepID=A0AAJ4Z8D7_PANPU|nr:ABC transporter permease subunit [Pandoraea pulmonicola]AJC22266.1 ABC transporter permease [Pandoraea pulmonicola]SUA88677.1 Putrescine transport system permease protein PotH [Pandoraea pulmonicola]